MALPLYGDQIGTARPNGWLALTPTAMVKRFCSLPGLRGVRQASGGAQEA